MKLSRADFAEKCGVSKMAISKAVRRGALIEDDAGRLDTADPINRAYLRADHHVMKRAQAKGARSEKAGRAAASKRRAQLSEAKLKAEVRLKEEQANYHVQRRAKELGLLVDRAIVERLVATLTAELKLRFLGLPRQIAQELYDLAHSKGATPMALEGLLLERISDGIVHIKEHAKQAGLDPVDR